MQVTAVICEYNPLHLGHEKQLKQIRHQFGPDSGIVCLMSGNYVQRGHPAILDKSLRAEAALLCGADLVLEMPLTGSLSSAEGFAAQGVRILSGFCDSLCFGAETQDPSLMMHTAEALLTESFSFRLRQELGKGLSFPASRQRALESMGISAAFLTEPNNILATEYCKAILSQGSPMKPYPILRQGSYHATLPDPENPSATALRQQMLQKGHWMTYVPEKVHPLFENAPLHTLAAGEQGILYRLRTMPEESFSLLPYGSEGLWRKLMHAARNCSSLTEIVDAVKSKRYTRSRIDRMILCATLGLTSRDLETTSPYVRVLALNHRGGQILKNARNFGNFLNAGVSSNDPYAEIERRAQDLYGLFCLHGPEKPGAERRRRILYKSP